MENVRNQLQEAQDRMCNNFRPVQPVNDRKVFFFTPRKAIQPTMTPARTPTPTSAASEDAAMARIVPGLKSMPLAGLVGSPAKVPDLSTLVGDTRHDLQGALTANGPKGENTKDQLNVQQSENTNSAFAHSLASKESKLIPVTHPKQELNKDVQNVKGFAEKPIADKQLNNSENPNVMNASKNGVKPTVAPGMRRENV